jgi:alkylhydroperoxidase/carboxymuconolactone decarboxylase family protein YurZ
MNLDSKTRAVIAVGCATAANCTGCLEKTVSIAKELGVGEGEIGAAINVGRRVRAGAAAKLDQFAATVNSASAEPSQAKSRECALHRILKQSRR